MSSINLYGLISPWAKDATGPDWVLTAKEKDGDALTITGATFTGKLRERSGGITVSLTAASFSITTAASGIFTYVLGAADVAVAGMYDLVVKITISTKVYIGKMPVEIVDTF